MSKVKYKEGVSNFGFGGQEYPADEDGCADLPAEAIGAAVEHGILAPADEQPVAEDEPDAYTKEWLDFLDQNVGAIQDALPPLSDEQLAYIHELETAGKKRKGVLEAVEALQADRKED